MKDTNVQRPHKNWGGRKRHYTAGLRQIKNQAKALSGKSGTGWIAAHINFFVYTEFYLVYIH